MITRITNSSVGSIVAYVKNAAGQMAKLHTWRDETGNPDITRWYYDLFTGAVTSKLYADGNGAAYTYLDDGRIASRLWARNNITTTYGYIDTDTGSIRTTEYNDTTPSLTNTFNLAGQMISVQDGVGTTTFGYNSQGRQTAETNELAIITRSYDSFGRSSQCVLDPAYPGYPCLIINYSYDVYNRLDTVTAIIGTETNTFTYSYIPGSQLISGYTALTSSTPSTILTVSKTYEPYRNLITAITNSVGAVPSVVSAFIYSNDATGKRTARSDYYNGSNVNNAFNFNARGEVTNAVMNSNTCSYDFDDIGNRLQSTVNSGQSVVTNTYIANQLNQYSSILNSQFTIPYSPTHDLDGNLTFDGTEWHHSYNGENRLISSSNEVTGVYVTYAYDYQNRRTSMTTLTPDPFSSLTRKYVWDGFNIAAEIIIDNVAAATNITYYTWGLDLSGSLQGAGGVGGLLSETKVTTPSINTYYALSDANGNITEYIDENGTLKAHGKHSAFGETELSGTMKDQFTHWFSTKPLDAKTGLVSYELRYLKPDFAFLSRDPIGLQGGPNEYGFVNNDAVNLFDLLGLDFIAIGIRSAKAALGLQNHMPIEFYEEKPACTKQGYTFKPSDVGKNKLKNTKRLDQFELIPTFSDYGHRHSRTVLGKTVQWTTMARISFIYRTSTAYDLMVVYDDKSKDAAKKWNLVVSAALGYKYAEQIPIGSAVKNWPNSKYQLPPGNNSNTFIHEMAHVIGKNASVFSSTPGAKRAVPVKDNSSVPVYKATP